MIGTPIQSPEQLYDDLTDALISIVDEHTDALIDLTDNIVGLRPFPDTPLPPGHDIIVIPRVTPQEGFKAMQDFVATLPDEEARDRLNLRLIPLPSRHRIFRPLERTLRRHNQVHPVELPLPGEILHNRLMSNM